MKTIVTAVDFSDATVPVLVHAQMVSEAFHAELHVVHVVEMQPSYATMYGFAPEEVPAMGEFMNETEKRAMEHLDKLDVKASHRKVLQGSPLHAILEYTKSVGGELLVLGCHGHGVLGSLFMGSVADGCVRKAEIPTLVVPVIK